MFGSFLDKMGGFFDRRFLVAYVIPTLVTLGLIIALSQTLLGLKVTLNWWITLQGQEQIFLVVAVILALIVFSYIFETLTAPIVRLYEGYWTDKGLWGLVTRMARKRQQQILDKNARTKQRDKLDVQIKELLGEYASLNNSQLNASENQKTIISKRIEEIRKQEEEFREELEEEERRAYNANYYSFPYNPQALKPTSLGNVLAAAEEYSSRVYQLEAVVWWPRLATLLPEDFRIQIDAALTPMLAVINLSMICIALALCAGILLLFFHQWLFWGITFLCIGSFFGRVFYMTATRQADIYGRLVRVAFDLYRHEILIKMHIPVPTSIASEMLLWDQLTQWHYFHLYPDSSEAENEPPIYYYDTYNAAIDPISEQEIILTIKGASRISVKNEETDHKNGSQRGGRWSGIFRR